MLTGQNIKHGRGQVDALSRKDRRKAERNQKKQPRSFAKNHATQISTKPGGKANVRSPQAARNSQAGTRKGAVRESRQAEVSRRREPELEDQEQEDDDDNGSLDEDIDKEFGGFDDESEDDNEAPNAPRVSRSVKDRLAQDDAEIAALERKLGIKGRKSLPKSFDDDGLGELLGDLDGFIEETSEKKKRKAEADEWLAQKRRRAATQSQVDDRHAGATSRESDTDMDEDSNDDHADDMSLDLDEDNTEGDESEDDDELDGSGSDAVDLEGLSSEYEAQRSASRAPVRENPYVAPTTGNTGASAAKWVPPSRRRAEDAEDESLMQLRRQIRGLTNRISAPNLVPLSADVEKLYRDNPRQHVSSSLIDQLLALVCNDAAVTDNNFLLLAAFATAVYKVVGTDFGAHLIEAIVERFQGHYDRALLAPAERADSKRTLNLISFLSGLYNFQLVGSNLLFDYIRLLLEDLSELNAELLLRITRISGPGLRQDDPLALKDIVALIGAAVAKAGKDKISVRTSVMIDSINDLKNNKRSHEGRDGASDYTTQTRKVLGSLNTRKLEATEPLRMGLKDIQESEKKGKWWLVGASWAGRASETKAEQNAGAGQSDSEDDDTFAVGDENAPNLVELAREQMMNTDVRRSIFVAIMSANDYEDAFVRLMKLRLNKERQREIPNVVMQCAGAEQQYNPYYTLIAKRLCSDRKIRWSFQDSLWRLFRRLGESIFGDDVEDEDEDNSVDLRRVVNIAKMIGSLVGHGALSLTILKCLDLHYLQPKTQAFVEVLLITVFLQCAEQGNEDPQAAARNIFAAVAESTDLARGLQWFIRSVVRKSDLIGGKLNAKTVKKGCKIAEAVLDRDLAEEEAEDQDQEES